MGKVLIPSDEHPGFFDALGRALSRGTEAEHEWSSITGLIIGGNYGHLVSTAMTWNQRLEFIRAATKVDPEIPWEVEEPWFAQVRALLPEAFALKKRRNEIAHGAWAFMGFDHPVVMSAQRNDKVIRGRKVKLDELTELAASLFDHTRKVRSACDSVTRARHDVG